MLDPDPYPGPYSMNPDPQLWIPVPYLAGSVSDQDSIRIQGFDDQKLRKIYSWKKNSIRIPSSDPPTWLNPDPKHSFILF